MVNKCKFLLTHIVKEVAVDLLLDSKPFLLKVFFTHNAALNNKKFQRADADGFKYCFR
ncbi:hypothetical protein SAMN04488079_11365 [Methylophaga sulfidovorans]|uniref:Uncharacterized protein n=1 Tax=Methylophaga sulfidovorans TaxID=45496 RepID=A0A1I4A7W6_9GAMM|nr:hypothetical protein SAMN04488079_11365 [Methylophaga sulfidovorans]